MTQQPLVIVGGGMAGAMLALLLRRHGASSVVLVESHPLTLPSEPPLTPSFDARSTALSAGTLAVLDDLGLGNAIREHAAVIGTVHVSRQSRLGLTRMSAEEEGVDQLGAVVENRWLGFVLLGALFNDEAISVRAPDSLSGIRRLEGGYQVSLSSGEVLETPLLIAADGARSQTREWLGISARDHDTGHDALIANLSVATPHEGIAYERFLNDGPLALLPLPDQRFALVWTGPRDQVDQWMAMDEQEALAQLQARCPAEAPRLTGMGERQRYPLVLTEACAQVVPHAVVVGNAAHTLHPVAGQGFNLTVRDLLALAQTVGGSDNPGSLATLQTYAEKREKDQALISQASRWVPELFRVQQPLFAHSRQLGLVALDIMPGLRSGFAKRAMGI
ncbi:FAD-dependent monooxygenase [Alcanivorax sp. S6407]|uniref:FAD-dependent monooxygenase n=1 Tax=Alcanivorax sp. S6407 TaxID=2926424 RepID=UPI001FF23DB0|nr:FAD-dependent monooxygenase [Alcanivorax sp. S6407]MCK0154250.1 FAD-dependent monooxygenase [Alcanivorax sp. S6407]